jgi:hypothetical protein
MELEYKEYVKAHEKRMEEMEIEHKEYMKAHEKEMEEIELERKAIENRKYVLINGVKVRID